MAQASKRKPITASKTVQTEDGQLIELTATAVKNDAAPKTLAKTAAKRRTKRTQQAVDALLETDELVKDQVGGFVTFIREHAIVGLAVGFIIGAQAQAVVKQLVTSFIEPVLKMIFGANLASASFTLHGAAFSWGAMVYALINLFAVLTTIYVLIKLLKLDKLDKPKTNS